MYIYTYIVWLDCFAADLKLKIFILSSCCDSVTQLCSTLPSNGLQHGRLPSPSPSTRACSNPCPLSQWCHPTISSSVIPFSSCFLSVPASRSSPMCWLFASGGQSTGASALASVLPVNIQDWFPLGLTGLILLSNGLPRVLQHHSSKSSAFFIVQLQHSAFFIV